MSVKYHLTLGPYAEFEPPSEKANILPPVNEDGEQQFSGRLWCDFYPCYDPAPRRRYRYVPDSGSPEREMHWQGQPPRPELPDLSGVNPSRELKWFAAEYRSELSELARHFGVKPRLHWGLLLW